MSAESLPPAVVPAARASRFRSPRPPASVAVGIVIALATFAPLLTRGVVLLIDFGDYPVGPHPRIPTTAWGFPPGLTSRGPIEVLLVSLFRLASFGPLRLVPVLVVAPLAGLGFARLFRARPAASVPATVLFSINPFVYERLLAGQVYFVFGYALLPGFLSLLVPTEEGRPWRRGLLLGGLLALLIALAPHYLFIAGLLLTGVGVGALLRRDRRSLWLVASAAAASLALSTYWIVPGGSGRSLLGALSSGDLRAFRTAGDPRVHLLGNVAGLYGFWRQNGLPKYGFAPWPVVLVLILAVVGAGLRAGARSPRQRTVLLSLIVVAVMAFFLALGGQGPTGGLFTWLFHHVSAFRIMREPQKFVALLALGYAVFYGFGAESLLARARSVASRRAVASLLVAIPCVYTYTMFWGFHGNVRTARFPTSWAEADRLMGNGSGKVVAFPWHLYETFPWNHDASTPNPAGSYFRRQVIVSPDAEQAGVASQSVDARSRYVQFLVGEGARLHHFGNLVAPLDVQYILLSKVNDWAGYKWLYQQRDVHLVREWDDLALFENTQPSSEVSAPRAAVSVSDWGQVVGLSEKARLTDLAVRVRNPRPGPLSTPTLPTSVPAAAPVHVSGHTVQYKLAQRPAGGYLVLAEPYDHRWAYGTVRAAPNLGVTNLFPVRSAGGPSTIDYRRWDLVRASYLVSGAILALLTLLIAMTRTRRSGTSRGRRPRLAFRARDAARREGSSGAL